MAFLWQKKKKWGDAKAVVWLHLRGKGIRGILCMAWRDDDDGIALIQLFC
jgi:hypothetical protein